MLRNVQFAVFIVLKHETIILPLKSNLNYVKLEFTA